MAKDLKTLLRLRVAKAKKVIGKAPKEEIPLRTPIKPIELGRKGLQYRLP